MTLSEDLRPAVEILRTWGSSKPFVRRLWLYGSRVKGTARPDSDLDVAVEIDSIGSDQSMYTSFHYEAATWSSEIQPHISYPLHLKWYDRSNQPVWEGVNSAGHLVYERAT